MRESPPLATGRQDVQDRLDHIAQIDLPRPSQTLPGWQLSYDQPPFCIGHIACIAQPAPLILRSSDFSPSHCDLPRFFANPKESHLTEITHLFFGQTLRMRMEQAAGFSNRLFRPAAEVVDKADLAT